jgi:pimeloyl-ACP methyl ester carboxylesterase
VPRCRSAALDQAGLPAHAPAGGVADTGLSVTRSPSWSSRSSTCGFSSKKAAASSPPPAQPPGIRTHSDDASRLLAALTDKPVFVFGSSLGALIGLDLITAHPQQVRLLIAHEAACASLLDQPERSQILAMQRLLTEFPGNHSGYALRPREFAEALQQALTQDTAPSN